MGLPSKNTGVGGHLLLQRIFPTQGLNPGLLQSQVGSSLSEPPGRPFLDLPSLKNFLVSLRRALGENVGWGRGITGVSCGSLRKAGRAEGSLQGRPRHQKEPKHTEKPAPVCRPRKICCAVRSFSLVCGKPAGSVTTTAVFGPGLFLGGPSAFRAGAEAAGVAALLPALSPVSEQCRDQPRLGCSSVQRFHQTSDESHSGERKQRKSWTMYFWARNVTLSPSVEVSSKGSHRFFI